MSDKSTSSKLNQFVDVVAESVGPSFAPLIRRLNGDWELSFITTLFVDELYPRLGAFDALLFL